MNDLQQSGTVGKGNRLGREMSLFNCLRLLCVISLLTSPLLSQGTKPVLEEFHLTLAGDAIVVSPVAAHQSDPRFLSVVNAIRRGDAAVINFEGTMASREAYRAFDTGSTRIALEPQRLKDLEWIGFNLFSAANNHSLDYGLRGLTDTIHAFRQEGAHYAGIGENLGEARAPTYLSTSNGRVALISFASSFSEEAVAGESRSDSRGRPGLSPSRFRTRYLVDSATFETLRKLKNKLNLDGKEVAPKTLSLSFDSSKSGRINGIKPVTFELSDKPGVVTSPEPQDLAEISDSIREARTMADYVVPYIHAHEAAPSSNEVPAQFLVEYAHALVDAGADVFVGAGPHLLRGIEIYKGKPIFYSLGNFIQEVDLVLPKTKPSETYNRSDPSNRNREGGVGDSRSWESVVAEVTFRAGHPVEVLLTPITLGFNERMPDRGYPKLADPVKANEILKYLQRVSEPLGTHMAIKNGLGLITIEDVPQAKVTSK